MTLVIRAVAVPYSCLQFGGYVFPSSGPLANVGSIVGIPSTNPSIQLEDPLFPGANAAAACFAYSRIVALFEETLHALRMFYPSMFYPTPLSLLINRFGYHNGAGPAVSHP
jgi:hypothetical protein